MFTTDNEYYTITTRLLRYVFESDKEVRFYFDESDDIYDTTTNSIVKDQVNILSVNTQPRGLTAGTLPFTYDLKWDVTGRFSG